MTRVIALAHRPQRACTFCLIPAPTLDHPLRTMKNITLSKTPEFAIPARLRLGFLCVIPALLLLCPRSADADVFGGRAGAGTSSQFAVTPSSGSASSSSSGSSGWNSGSTSGRRDITDDIAAGIHRLYQMPGKMVKKLGRSIRQAGTLGAAKRRDRQQEASIQRQHQLFADAMKKQKNEDERARKRAESDARARAAAARTVSQKPTVADTRIHTYGPASGKIAGSTQTVTQNGTTAGTKSRGSHFEPPSPVIPQPAAKPTFWQRLGFAKSP